jgi:hypothetical protein
MSPKITFTLTLSIKILSDSHFCTRLTKQHTSFKHFGNLHVWWIYDLMWPTVSAVTVLFMYTLVSPAEQNDLSPWPCIL